MRRNGLSKIRVSGAVVLLSVAAVARAAGTNLERAEEAYQRTDYKATLNTLLPVTQKNAAVYALTGKAYYMDGQYKYSASCLEKAVMEDPLSSNYYDWLGKAYGRRAEQSSFLTALPYANKTRDAFEKAVALDPSNLEALGDLFEYYLQAPGIVGGGVDKAEGVAVRIGRLSEAEYHYDRARIAEKRKNIQVAEEELRKAMQLAPGHIGRVIDLARFLSEHGRYEESDNLFRTAAQIEPDSPKLMFARAAAYIHSGRNLEDARMLLRQYAESRITPDDPPRSEVAKLLERSR
ncbi:MAG: tetratricopeptide repeat protein [Bryobacteraceae bacterium]